MIFKRELRCSRIETFSSSIYSQSFFEGHIHHPWQLSSPGCVYSIPCDLKFVKSPTPVKPIPGETGLSPRMGSFGVIGCAIQLTTVNLSLGHIWSPYCFFFCILCNPLIIVFQTRFYSFDPSCVLLSFTLGPKFFSHNKWLYVCWIAVYSLFVHHKLILVWAWCTFFSPATN